MLSDTIVLTVAGSSRTFTRNGFGDKSSSYFCRDAMGNANYTLKFRHTIVAATKNRLAVDRHNVELTKIQSNALLPNDLPKVYRTYVVFESPPSDPFTTKFMSEALYTELIASANALLDQLGNYEV